MCVHVSPPHPNQLRMPHEESEWLREKKDNKIKIHIMISTFFTHTAVRYLRLQKKTGMKSM